MPISQSRLSKSIEDSIFSELSKALDGVTKTPYLSAFANGVSTGFCNYVINSKGSVASTGQGISAIGIQGVEKEPLSELIQSNIKKSTQSEGPGLKPFCDGLAEAVVNELKQALVTSQDSGIAKHFSGWSASQMADAMFNATGFYKTEYNNKFFLGIAQGITEKIQQDGFANIPKVDDTSGSGVAIVT